MTRDRATPGGADARRKSALDLIARKAAGERIVMVTAYDATSARLAEAAGVDVILVGDSAATTMLGHPTTIPVTMDEMLVLTGAVARAAHAVPIVADMPFGSYQASNRTAVAHATRFVKDAGANAVKLEGAGPTVARVRAIVASGIPVVGHVGLTPQSASLAGSFKAAGRTAAEGRRIADDARALEDAGCCAIVLEAVPPPVSARISEALRIPTIGIGAGSSCDGQVLVWHDLLGLTPGPLPRFVKQYATLGQQIAAAVGEYARDVRRGAFPAAEHTYAMSADERREFEQGAGAALAGPHRRS